MSASERLKINPVLTWRSLIHLIENEVSKSGFRKGVVGLSGGVYPAPNCSYAADCSFAANSSFDTACSLNASALRTANVIAMRLPYRELADENPERAQLIDKEPEICSETVDITPFVEPMFNTTVGGQSRLSIVSRLGRAQSFYSIVNTRIGE